MTEPKATRIAFEQRYSDDSGVEFGVRYTSHPWPGCIEFECVGTLEFPVEKLDWLIDCLQRIRTETSVPAPSLKEE